MIRRFTPSPTIEDMKQIAAIDKTELTQSVLGLQFWVTSEHFQSGKLKVKCRGQIPSVYFAESDTLIVGEHDGPQHKVLQATSGSAPRTTNMRNPHQGKCTTLSVYSTYTLLNLHRSRSTIVGMQSIRLALMDS